MMTKLFSVISAILIAGQLSLAASSAVRAHGESWHEARERNLNHSISRYGVEGQTPLQSAKPLEQWDVNQVQALESEAQLNELFNYVRDTKFMKNLSAPLTERRLSWLFPDDGCFVRAEIAADHMVEKHAPPAGKIFVFGNLVAKTDNHPDGVVQWWYHVAPVYRVGNELWVIDPAIEPKHPLTAQEWKRAVSYDGGTAEKFSLCGTHTLDPDDSCDKPQERKLEPILNWQKSFLNQEWSRLQQMGRDPLKELGDNPPWL